MTDKATVTIPSGVDGRVIKRTAKSAKRWPSGCRAGELRSLGKIVEAPASRRIGQWQGKPRRSLLRLSPDGPATVPHGPADGRAPTATATPRKQASRMASPAVRRRARELHVDLQHVPGSGPNGRITHGDIDVFLRTEFAPAAPRRMPGSHTTEIQMAGLRRRIAEKMVVSNNQIPHFTYIEEIDITELEALREHLNGHRTDGQPKLTYLPFIMLAVTRALGRFSAAQRPLRRQARSDHALRSRPPRHRHANRSRPVCAGRSPRRGDGPLAGGPRNAAHHRGRPQSIDLAQRSLRLHVHRHQPRLDGRHWPRRRSSTTPRSAILGINKAIDRPVVHQGQIAIRRMVQPLRLVRPPRRRRRRRRDLHPVHQGLPGAPGDDLYLERSTRRRKTAAAPLRSPAARRQSASASERSPS